MVSAVCDSSHTSCCSLLLGSRCLDLVDSARTSTNTLHCRTFYRKSFLVRPSGVLTSIYQLGAVAAMADRNCDPREAALRRLLFSVGPPHGPLAYEDLMIVFKYTTHLALAGFDTLEALQTATFEDFLSINITRGAGRLLKKAFPHF